MASWEPALVAAITRAVGGENPIETIDHEAKVIEIKRDARVEPSVLRNIEREVGKLGIGYRIRAARLGAPIQAATPRHATSFSQDHGHILFPNLKPGVEG